MNEKSQSKWTGPDEINGVLHVGKGYRQVFMHMADRMRTDREQWYPGDGEKGEDGIWGDARPGSFDPSKVYRVPVKESDVGQGNRYVAFAVGYRKARPEDCWRTDRHEIVFTDELGSYKWIQATPGENHPSAIYRVPVERRDEPGVYGDSQGEAVPPVEQTAGPCKLTPGYRFAGNIDRNRLDRMEWVTVAGPVSSGFGWWGEANPGTYYPTRSYQVPRVITAASYPPSQDKGATVQPPVGEFDGGGREGGPDCQTGESDAVESDSTNDREDMVNRPPHYNQGGIECIDAIEAMMTEDQFRAFCLGNVLKYIWRADHKGGTEDLRKAAWYLDRAIGEWWEGCQ